jgi:hypothetical protein
MIAMGLSVLIPNFLFDQAKVELIFFSNNPRYCENQIIKITPVDAYHPKLQQLQ